MLDQQGLNRHVQSLLGPARLWYRCRYDFDRGPRCAPVCLSHDRLEKLSSRFTNGTIFDLKDHPVFQIFDRDLLR
jgi:hypothetical protein